MHWHDHTKPDCCLYSKSCTALPWAHGWSHHQHPPQQNHDCHDCCHSDSTTAIVSHCLQLAPKQRAQQDQPNHTFASLSPRLCDPYHQSTGVLSASLFCHAGSSTHKGYLPKVDPTRDRSKHIAPVDWAKHLDSHVSLAPPPCNQNQRQTKQAQTNGVKRRNCYSST